MRKTFRTLGITLALTLLAAIPAYAGQMQQSGIALRYLKDDGTYAANEWVLVGDSYYYFDKNGNSASGWIRLNRTWYYLEPETGKMKTGWLQNTDGSWYYFDDETGAMLSKTRTPDGYYVEKNGKYNPEKGNINDADDINGPGAGLEEQERLNTLNGVTFPNLTGFATANLATDTWGIEGSMDALLAAGKNIMEELKSKNIEVTGDNVFYVDGTSITFATNGVENPIFKLTKNGDHYRLYDYANIDKEYETPLFALCSMISSNPQAAYNAMYEVAQYNRQRMSEQTYQSYGDTQMIYTIVGDYDYFYFSIKAK